MTVFPGTLSVCVITLAVFLRIQSYQHGDEVTLDHLRVVIESTHVGHLSRLWEVVGVRVHPGLEIIWVL